MYSNCIMSFPIFRRVRVCVMANLNYYLKRRNSSNYSVGLPTQKAWLRVVCPLSFILIFTTNKKIPKLICEASLPPNKISRDYKSENALSDLLMKIRDALNQIHSGDVQLRSNDGLYIAIVYSDSIRIQIISKSTIDALEFMDCEYHWMTSDITKAEFCRLESNSTIGTRVDINSSDAFDLIYRTVFRISIDLPANKCQLSRNL